MDVPTRRETISCYPLESGMFDRKSAKSSPFGENHHPCNAFINNALYPALGWGAIPRHPQSASMCPLPAIRYGVIETRVEGYFGLGGHVARESHTPIEWNSSAWAANKLQFVQSEPPLLVEGSAASAAAHPI